MTRNRGTLKKSSRRIENLFFFGSRLEKMEVMSKGRHIHIEKSHFPNKNDFHSDFQPTSKMEVINSFDFLFYLLREK